MSSGENELYAVNRTAAEGLGIRSLLLDSCVEAELELLMDSTAAMGLLWRQGLGRAKHIEIQELWLQDVVRSGRVRLKKVHTDVNPADLGTKPLPFQIITNLVKLMGYNFVEKTGGEACGRTFVTSSISKRCKLTGE